MVEVQGSGCAGACQRVPGFPWQSQKIDAKTLGDRRLVMSAYNIKCCWTTRRVHRGVDEAVPGPPRGRGFM
jgi:hypothetical protein